MLAEIPQPNYLPGPISAERPGVPVQLTELCEGRCARLHTAQLDNDECALLRALGLTSKCRLRVCKAGDPWIVQVRETRIGLSAQVAQKILVIPEAEA